ncbi:alpha/beta hydrolase [Actinomadura sp. NAK00032]|nr:alpha/beta hydrolase [Actinomadura sp. NAK00032]
MNASTRTATEAGVTLYLHGGGFAHTDPRAERALAYQLSSTTQRPVFGVDYRLVPEHPYPAALDDVTTVYQSLIDQGVPTSRIALFGESAGATLVLSALLTLKETRAPLPATAVVVSPLTDLTLSSPSLTANDGWDLISKAVLEQVCANYLAGARPDLAPASPLHGDLAGLPDLLVVAGAAEILVDDARRLAAAATAVGTTVDLDVYEGMPHVFHLAMLSGTPTSTTTTFLRRLADWTERRCA